MITRRFYVWIFKEKEATNGDLRSGRWSGDFPGRSRRRCLFGKIVGDGIAVIPEKDQIVVPVDGEISFVMETGHAFGVRVPDGPEILVHIGIDTVNEKGEGFQVQVKAHQPVKAGTPAVLVDREALYKKGYNLVTMVLVPEVESYGSLQYLKKGEVCAGKSAVLAF